MKKMKINSFFKSLQTHRFQHLSLLLAVAIIVSLQLTACKKDSQTTETLAPEITSKTTTKRSTVSTSSTSEATEASASTQTIISSTEQIDKTTLSTTSTAKTSSETIQDATSATSSETTAIATTASQVPTTRQTTTEAIQATDPADDPNSLTVKVTIPEGFSMIQIIDRLVASGVNSREALLKSAANDDFSSFEIIKSTAAIPNRCWQLEGYLYPDTYEFYRGEDPKSVWSRFLSNFTNKTKQYQSQLSRFNWTFDQAVTFASLLEREAGNPEEVAKVSSVMHNRLNSGMPLQLDASIDYVEKHIKPYISGNIDRYNSYYNTYKTPALPSGPISNPGARALNATLNPANTDYLYFATDNSEPPKYYYSLTYDEHDALIRELGIGIYE